MAPPSDRRTGPRPVIRVTGPGADTMAAGATENEAHIVPRDYLAYRDRNQSFDGLAAGHVGGPMRVRVDGPPQMVPVTPRTGPTRFRCVCKSSDV
jgi:hypothetical protein